MVDTRTVESPGWWAQRLTDQLVNNELPRMHRLGQYLNGDAPLPEGASGMREAYREFQRRSRTNFAEIITEAVQERMTVSGFRIGSDDLLAKEAARIWSTNELDAGSTDVHGDMLAMSRGVVIVGPPEARSKRDWLLDLVRKLFGSEAVRTAVITREDPRQVAVQYDPQNPNRVIAALKLYRDDVAGEDVAFVYLPGVIHHYRRRSEGSSVSTDISTYRLVETTKLPHPVVPVVSFRNHSGFGEFETHLDVIDRINYMVLQRLVITAMQAFRQRAIKGDLPETDEAGDPINYGEIFRPGAGSLWQLPEGTELWESSQTEFQTVLNAVKDDIRDLAAVTRTPMSMLLPDGQNQSAEGAAFAREGLVFKVADRIKRATYGWNQVMQLALLFGGHGLQTDIQTMWLPADRLSLAERADAMTKLSMLPLRTLLRDVMGMNEAEIERVENERLDDILASALGAPAQESPENAVGVSGSQR